MAVTANNTDSTVDTAIEAESALSANKRGRKKRFLNDKSEAAGEDINNAKMPGKPGRPKKVKEEDISQPKAQQAQKPKIFKQIKQDQKMSRGFDVKAEACGIKQERDDKSTEISSSASKLEDSPGSMKSKTPNFMNEMMKLKAPENLKEILGGMNIPAEVKEFLEKSNWMGQGSSMEAKKIGTLTIAERKAKIEKYLEKRKKRTWSRKINYDCRKRVADSRLRIKGRFVTRDQAFPLLDEAGIKYDAESITNAEIKSLLTEKFGGNTLKKKVLENLDATLNTKRANDKQTNELDMEDNEDLNSDLSE